MFLVIELKFLLSQRSEKWKQTLISQMDFKMFSISKRIFLLNVIAGAYNVYVLTMAIDATHNEQMEIVIGELYSFWTCKQTMDYDWKCK